MILKTDLCVTRRSLWAKRTQGVSPVLPGLPTPVPNRLFLPQMPALLATKTLLSVPAPPIPSTSRGPTACRILLRKELDHKPISATGQVTCRQD